MECHAKIVIEANCVVNYSRVREKEREKMVKGNDGCGMKQAKKSASKTGTQFRIEQLIVLKTAADHVILYREATKELLLFSACDFRTIRFFLPQPERI